LGYILLPSLIALTDFSCYRIISWNFVPDSGIERTKEYGEGKRERQQLPSLVKDCVEWEKSKRIKNLAR